MILGYLKKTWKGDVIEINEPTIGYVQVKYTCDEKDCADNKKIHISRYSSMIDLNKWNNINHQMCKSCRTRKSERDIKNNNIKYQQIVEELNKEGYLILTTKEEFEKSMRPSAVVLKVVCPNGHKHNISWNNWKNKNRRCRKCYDENRFNNAIKYKEGYDEYRFCVERETQKSYKTNKHIIGMGRNKLNHLDHKYSIYQGFIDKIDPKIIGSVCNLQILPFNENISKGCRCSITKEELISEYLRKD
jgi:hypothetical protein